MFRLLPLVWLVVLTDHLEFWQLDSSVEHAGLFQGNEGINKIAEEMGMEVMFPLFIQLVTNRDNQVFIYAEAGQLPTI